MDKLIDENKNKSVEDTLIELLDEASKYEIIDQVKKTDKRRK